jgi:acyl-CoA reductase-like NAD-dependent aldehyde dehydrogenase
MVRFVTAVEPALLQRQAFVDGKWVDAVSGEVFAVTNPTTGEVLAEVPRMGAAEARQALAAAENALLEWRHRTAKQRASVPRHLADLMLEHEDDLARRGNPRRHLPRVARWCSSRPSRRHSPRCLGCVHRVAEALEYGIVGINTGLTTGSRREAVA